MTRRTKFLLTIWVCVFTAGVITLSVQLYQARGEYIYQEMLFYRVLFEEAVTHHQQAHPHIK